jgi:hypothetical protein
VAAIDLADLMTGDGMVSVMSIDWDEESEVNALFDIVVGENPANRGPAFLTLDDFTDLK